MVGAVPFDVEFGVGREGLSRGGARCCEGFVGFVGGRLSFLSLSRRGPWGGERVRGLLSLGPSLRGDLERARLSPRGLR